MLCFASVCLQFILFSSALIEFRIEREIFHFFFSSLRFVHNFNFFSFFLFFFVVHRSFSIDLRALRFTAIFFASSYSRAMFLDEYGCLMIRTHVKCANVLEGSRTRAKIYSFSNMHENLNFMYTKRTHNIEAKVRKKKERKSEKRNDNNNALHAEGDERNVLVLFISFRFTVRCSVLHLSAISLQQECTRVPDIELIFSSFFIALHRMQMQIIHYSDFFVWDVGGVVRSIVISSDSSKERIRRRRHRDYSLKHCFKWHFNKQLQMPQDIECEHGSLATDSTNNSEYQMPTIKD